MVNYHYNNIGYSSELKITYSSINVYDEETEKATVYSSGIWCDHEKSASACITGTKASASYVYALSNESSSVTVYVSVKDSNGTTHKAQFIVNVTPVEEEPEAVDETVEETVQTGVVVKGPVKVKPIKTVKKKGDRGSDAGSFLAKIGLDGLKPIHWILICVGLVVLISIIGAISRSNERRRLEQRAARLRNSEGLSLGGRKGDNSKLRIK